MTRQLTLADFIEGIGGWHPEGMEMPVCPILDSRKAGPGTVFCAFKGEQVDGHDYVADAFARGAVAALVDRDVAVEATSLDMRGPAHPEHFVTPLLIRVSNVLQALQSAARSWRLQLSPRVVAITGSVGKTTTKELVTRVLENRYRVLYSTGSYNNEIGLPLTLLQLTGNHERVVLEMGMYVRGDIKLLAEIAHPHVGIITNVESVHTERAGSIENVALGKQELVEALPPAPDGIAILNYDDRRVRAMAEHTQAKVFFYGLSSQADLWADEVESLGLEGIRVRLHYGQDQLYVKVPLLGRHSAQTVLRAAAIGLVEGLDWQDIVEGLRAPATQLRLMAVPGPHDSLVLDDTYNASPPSVLAALNLMKDLQISNGRPFTRKIAVLGDMLELGDYEESGHFKVGCRAANVVQELVAVGELARHIARGAELCGMRPEHIHLVADSEAATALLCQILQPNDLILVKGSRAMKMETIVAALAALRDDAACAAAHPVSQEDLS
ncbi:MAG: UDP-N-acetylmuramoyl-tripeptide--D-alanyl-D-alanine ligase [Anaerolineae bacterium]|nr:UDP-N-acetylmuramoyl-tripeptide--D-alanyl-D-alanine ligase [Anaerolineae bacterium]